MDLKLETTVLRPKLDQELFGLPKNTRYYVQKDPRYIHIPELKVYNVYQLILYKDLKKDRYEEQTIKVEFWGVTGRPAHWLFMRPDGKGGWIELRAPSIDNWSVRYVS